MSNKDKRNKRDDIIIYTAGTLLLFGLAGWIGNGIANTFVVNKFVEGKVQNPKAFTTKESIISAAKEAMNSKRYMVAFVEQEEPAQEGNEAKENGVSATYTYRVDKKSGVTAYTYINNIDPDNNMLIEYWKQNDNDKWDTYIWSSEVRSYVQFELEEQPISMLTWDILDNLDDYVLLDQYGEWGDTPESCYVLAIYGTSDIWDTIAEYIYISRSTLLPQGIITAGSNSVEDINDFATSATTDKITSIKEANQYYLYEDEFGTDGFSYTEEVIATDTDSAEDVESNDVDNIEVSTETEEYSTELTGEIEEGDTPETDTVYESKVEIVEESSYVEPTTDYEVEGIEYEFNDISIVRISYNWTNMKPNEVKLPTKVISEEEYANAIRNEE